MDNYKIGARLLSDNEAKLILPTFDQIFSQIKDMRATLTNDKQEVTIIQKTNNIGILGCRGIGKTSVLKTIAKRLETFDKNENNIVLPIIIPENMSTSSTLMATILGLFKKVVEEEIEKDKKTNRNCIGESDNTLKRKYNDVIKQYTYIQKEYRDVLINEFTTENEYVKKSSEIFNSDIEFITKFNEFIEDLVKAKGKKTLIFLFIDDIDLSASRCTDVIKTLLSYISHENIITFISGALDTFEEAITIDLLRSENALTDEVWNGVFSNNGETLIERKKSLAYEYLKKIVPPVYRHNIKRWSLEDRGNYYIEENNENSNAEKLTDLFLKTLNQYIKPSYFKFVNFKSDPNGVEEILPYTNHLFDDTSRGLNNVYNVLLSLKTRKTDNGIITFSDKKILIETIASSKQVFNKYGTELFEKIVNFGSDEKSTVIRFDNLLMAMNIAMGTTRMRAISNENEVSPVEQFQLFIFVDFVSKLIGYGGQTSVNTDIYYSISQTSILNILVKNPIISGSSVILKNIDNLRTTSIEAQRDAPLELVSNFLLKSELDFALTFYKYLSMDTYQFLPNSRKIKSQNRKSKLSQNYMWSLFLSLKSISQMQNIKLQDYIASIYDRFAGEFAYIQDYLPSSEIRNTVAFIFGNIINASISKLNEFQKVELSEEDRLNEDNIKIESRELEYGRLITNLIYEIIKDKIFDSKIKIKTLNDEYLNNNYEEYNDFDELYEISRNKLIYNIHKNNLWSHPMAKTVKNYIENKIKIFIYHSSNMHLKEEIINIKDLKFSAAYNKFLDSYINEESDSKKSNLFEYINNNNWINFQKWFEIKSMVAELAYNNKLTYNQLEAQKMLSELNNLYPEYGHFNNYSSHNQYEIVRYLHYFAIYTIKEKNLDSIYLQSEQLSKFTIDISSSQKKVNDKMISDFMGFINEGLDKEMFVKQFEELFE